MIKYGVELSIYAELDVNDAAVYYDSKVPVLSLRFLDDLEEAILSISNNPFSFHIYKQGSDELDVKILAIIHERRSKSYIRRKLR